MRLKLVVVQNNLNIAAFAFRLLSTQIGFCDTEYRCTANLHRMENERQQLYRFFIIYVVGIITANGNVCKCVELQPT